MLAVPARVVTVVERGLTVAARSKTCLIRSFIARVMVDKTSARVGWAGRVDIAGTRGVAI